MDRFVMQYDADPEPFDEVADEYRTQDALPEASGAGDLLGTAEELGGRRGAMPRILQSMQMLGLVTGSQLEPLKKLEGAMEITIGLSMMYEAARSALVVIRERELVEAAAETAAALADPATWPLVAIASASAAAVFATFQVAEGNVHLPAVDLSDPVARRKAADQVGAMSNG